MFSSAQDNDIMIAHDADYQQLYSYFKDYAVAESWVITGPKYIGKSFFVNKLAKAILAKNRPNMPKISDMHPDLMIIDGANLSNITVTEIRKIHQFIKLSPSDAALKIIIIDDSDKLNINAANALLKILEEPNNSIFFLICHNLGKIPNTITSRCKKIRLNPLSPAQSLTISQNLKPDVDLTILKQILILTNNSPSLAILLYEINILDIYNQLLTMIFAKNIIKTQEIVKFYERIKLENHWDIFTLLINRLLAQIIKYHYDITLPIANEHNLTIMANNLNIEKLLELWDKLQYLLQSTIDSHLDHKQSALIILELLQKNLKNICSYE